VQQVGFIYKNISDSG